MAIDLIARAMAANGGGGGTPTDAYSKTETDALLKNKVGFAEYKDNKISFYNSILKDNIIGEIDLPVDMVVDQIKTKFSQKFKFDETTYPDTENPNLDGKPVLVLAIKTSATADTFSFLNMESLVDVYTGGTSKSAIISVDPETGVITNVVRISAETGNRIVQKDDGLFVPNQSASDVSYSNTTSKLKATTTQAAIDETLDVANEKYSKPSTGIPSADMAQSVKDSLVKADTALQEADKTELQGEIDDKLDKTAVLSDFSSEDLTNKVPSAKLVLDSFTKKVITEAVDNDTRIVTVPENVDCFGSIAMIGGKTQKCKNYVNSDDVKYNNLILSYENQSWINILTDEDRTFAYPIANTYANEVKVGSNLPYISIPGINKYYWEFTKDSTFNTIRFGHSGKLRDIKLNVDVSSLTNGKKYTLSAIISGNPTVVRSLKISEVQIENGEVYTSYEPYHEDLWNAPVEKVVLSGKNLVNFDTLIKGRLDNGVVGYDTGTTTLINNNNVISCVTNTTYRGFITDFIPVKSGEQYYLSFEKSDAVIANCSFFGSDKQFVVNQNKDASSAITVPSNASYIRIGFNFNAVGNHTITNLKFELGSTPTPYTPYNKTTISLSDIYGNLEEVFPGYGCSYGDVYNYIDFENGVYHKRIEHKLGKDMNFIVQTDTRYATCSDFTGTIKKPSSNNVVGDIICSKFNTDTNAQTENVCVSINTSGVIGIWKSGWTTQSAFNEGIKDAEFVFVLAEEELIPLSSIIPPIHVEPNGTIEFVNEHNLDVPTKVIYKKTV